MLTTEELRVAALEASAKRGKWVAKRRVWRRWLGWIIWTVILPVIGLAALLAVLTGLVFWQYLGHDAAYVAAQKWVQQEFGNFQSIGIANSNSVSINDDNANMAPSANGTLTDLRLDRHLKTNTQAN